MTTIIDFVDAHRNRWTKAVPSAKQPEVATFLSGVLDMVDGLVLPRPSSGIWRYASIPHFIFSEGKAFSSEPFTDDEMRILRSLQGLDPRGLVPAMGFRNSHLISRNVPELRYAEGLISYHDCLALHGWLELNGKAVDVSFSPEFDEEPCRTFAQMRHRIIRNQQAFRYYGVVFTGAEVARHLLGRKGDGSVIDCGACNHSILRRGLSTMAVGDHSAQVRPCTR